VTRKPSTFQSSTESLGLNPARAWFQRFNVVSNTVSLPRYEKNKFQIHLPRPKKVGLEWQNFHTYVYAHAYIHRLYLSRKYCTIFWMLINPALFLYLLYLNPANFFCSHKTVWYLSFDTDRIDSISYGGSTHLFGINAGVVVNVELVLIWLLNSQDRIKVILLLPWPLFPHLFFF
jgi:hypothetical protein